MSKVQVMDHPLIQHKVNYIRRKEVGSKEFREIVGEIAALMCYEATRDLKLQDVEIETPICKMVGIKREEIGSCTDLTCRTGNGRWNAEHDPGCKSRSYRSLQRSGNV